MVSGAVLPTFVPPVVGPRLIYVRGVRPGHRPARRALAAPFMVLLPRAFGRVPQERMRHRLPLVNRVARVVVGVAITLRIPSLVEGRRALRVPLRLRLTTVLAFGPLAQVAVVRRPTEVPHFVRAWHHLVAHWLVRPAVPPVAPPVREAACFV